MKKAYLKELSRQLLGSVTDSPDALEHFSTDASVFRITPAAVVYPKNTADVRKTVQFAAQRTSEGKPIGIVPRGKGSDQSGGAIGEGLQLVFPAHMHRVLHLERDTVTVQPGMLYGALQQVLKTHGRHLAITPSSAKYSTVGGAAATDANGFTSLKYGTMRGLVKSLKVVLSDGSLIGTKRLSARELARRKGQSDREGEVYRQLDNLLLDNDKLLRQTLLKLPTNTAGYALGEVRRRDGSFDLGQVVLGAQGTLGIITELTLRTQPYNPRNTLVVGFCATLDNATAALPKLRKLGPSALELVDGRVLEYLQDTRPGDLAGIVPDELPRAMLFVEFDDSSHLAQKLKSARAERIFGRLRNASYTATDPIQQQAFWKIRRDTVALMNAAAGSKKALPFIDEAVVPVGKFAELLDKTHKLLVKYDLQSPVWGHAGLGSLHIQPLFDPGKKRDMDRLASLSREFAHTVTALGGSPTTSYGDGLRQASYIAEVYGPQAAALMTAAKTIFDPQNIFNPGKKTDASESYVRQHLRDEYSLRHLHDYVPFT